MEANVQVEIASRKLADSPKNAILLQADIHTLFDDYQWSLWVCQINVIYFTFSNWPCSRNVQILGALWLFGLKSQGPQLWPIWSNP